MFLKTMQGIRQGAALTDLDQALYDLGLAVKQSGKAGELILKLKIVPVDSVGMAVHIEDSIVTKEPKMSKGKTIFFVDDAGQFVKNDPRQRSLDLRDVTQPTEQTDLKVVG
jgi:hypothetical protein